MFLFFLRILHISTHLNNLIQYLIFPKRMIGRLLSHDLAKKSVKDPSILKISNL